MDVVTALAHIFIPRESNNHKARVLQTPILVVFLFLFLILQKGLAVAPLNPQVLGYASQISPSEVIRLTNEKRAQAGLTTLAENTSLDAAAKEKGKDMLAKGYWAHVAPDGTQPWDFFKDVGYKYRYAGENLARDFTNPASTVEAWMASPSHRENLLSSHYKDIGVAVVEGNLNGKDATIVVQLFGATIADRPQVPVAKNPEENNVASVAAEAVQTTPPPALVSSLEEVTPPRNTIVEAPQSTSAAKWVSLAVIVFLLGAIVVDAFSLWLKGKTRSASAPFAHIAFFGMIIALIIVAKAGQIL